MAIEEKFSQHERRLSGVCGVPKVSRGLMFVRRSALAPLRHVAVAMSTCLHLAGHCVCRRMRVPRSRLLHDSLEPYHTGV